MTRFRYCSRTAALIVVLLLVGCSNDPDALAPGQEPYLRYCASCHGNQGEGKAPAFPPLAGSEWLEMGSDAVALIILGGLRGEIQVAGQTYRGYMPPMRHLSDQDITGLMGYIGGEWGDWPTPIAQERVAELRQAVGGRQPIQGLEGLQSLLNELQP